MRGLRVLYPLILGFSEETRILCSFKTILKVVVREEPCLHLLLDTDSPIKNGGITRKVYT